MSYKKPICIYHANCLDGFTAAWAIWKKFGNNCEYHAAAYNEDPPDVYKREVFIVDFSYSLPMMKQIAKSAERVVVLDHHKTAAEDLETLFNLGAIEGKFDMDKSGARLTWEWFHPNEPVPDLVMHVEDRDLWRFNFPTTENIMAYVGAQPHRFETWEILEHAVRVTPEAVVIQGVGIRQDQRRRVESMLKHRYRKVIAGYYVPVVNAPYYMASDLGEELARGEPFAAVWWQEPAKVVFSLRSEKGGLDVSEIAKKFGGGGHEHAAGFSIDGMEDILLISK